MHGTAISRRQTLSLALPSVSGLMASLRLALALRVRVEQFGVELGESQDQPMRGRGDRWP
jgi:hypothetical protein